LFIKACCVDDFIVEEFDKASRSILPWKLEWVKEQVKNDYIITKTDKGAGGLNVSKQSSFLKHSMLNKRSDSVLN
jgi:hypothetical protein